MRNLEFLEAYYNRNNEEGRLLSRHGQVEFLTTMRCIREALRPGMRVLDIGAGTGRYALPLAREGYSVEAVELVAHNVELIREKLRPGDPLRAVQGDALDLSAYADGTFGLTLLLGPMYHLYTFGEQTAALREALRVTAPGGHVLVAYCMNEATVVQYCFQKGMIHEVLAKNMLTEDFHCLSEAKDVFQLYRTEDIDRINVAAGAERVRLVASDGATNYMRDCVDAMDDKTFRLYLDYHFTVCARPDLIGASHHTLDILRKR